VCVCDFELRLDSRNMAIRDYNGNKKIGLLIAGSNSSSTSILRNAGIIKEVTHCAIIVEECNRAMEWDPTN
jgi:hypothetical protein